MKAIYALTVTACLLLASCNQGTTTPTATTPENTSASTTPSAEAQAILEQLRKATDFDQAFNQLTEAQRSAVLPLLQPAGELKTANVGDTGISAQAAGCWTATSTTWQENSLGGTLWKLFQKQNWCSNGTKITSASTERWYAVYYPGWRFGGWNGNSTSGGAGYTSYRSITQAIFILGAGGWDIQHSYPRIDRTVYR